MLFKQGSAARPMLHSMLVQTRDVMNKLEVGSVARPKSRSKSIRIRHVFEEVQN